MDNHNHKKPTTKPTPTTITNRVDPTRHHIPTKTTTNNPTRHPTKPKTNSLSMSDTDDEFHSPLPSPIPVDDSKAIVPVETNNNRKQPPPPPPSMHMTVTAAYNRTARDEVVTGVAKLSPGGGGGGGEVGGGGGGRTGRRVRKDVMVERLGLGFRVMEMVLCLIAFSVMASDKTQGWSGDSFDRYREYRYVVAVNAIGFSYAAFQAIDMTYHLIHGKHIVSYHLRPHFDFIIDQILAYLLISASSSAATRVDDWVSNWGKDDFTQMATASIGMSFLAFIAFALSSIISGYNLCNQNSL